MLHVDSRSRNRKIFPNPANFTVTFQGSNYGERLDTRDPVSNQSYMKIWTSNLFDQTSPGPFVSGVISPFFQAGTLSSAKQVVVTSTNPGGFRKADNYYRGATIAIGSVRRTVKSSTYLENNEMMFTCTENFPDTMTAGSAVQIQDPTQPSNGLFFVPHGLTLNNSYTNLLLYNETQQKSSKILNYNGDLALAQISDLSWALTDNIGIVRVPPAAFVSDGGSVNNIPILGNVSNVTNYYQGSYVYIPATVYDDATPLGEYTFITQYTVGRATLSLFPWLQNPVPVGATVLIWSTTTDNSTPLFNSGFLTANKKDIREICYDIRPVFLTLPNAALISGMGGTIAQNSYVLLSIETEPANDGNFIPLCTNTPAARRSMFAMRVPNITHLRTAEFVTLTSDDVKGRFQWKPNCHGLSIKIHFPNNDLFQTKEQDSTSPFEPKPHLQISLLLEMTSIVEKGIENRRFLIST